MKHDDTLPPVWSLTYGQLAAQCRSIADNQSADEALQTEAQRLCAAWQEAFGMRDDDFDEHARKAALQASLRKRAIEILIKSGEAT